jgi:hypothetical protein
MFGEIVVGLIVSLPMFYLMYRQNKIMEMDLESRGKSVGAPKLSIRRYWPMVAMLALALITWSAVGTWIYLRHTTFDLTKLPDAQMERVSGKTFLGGEIPIDGKLFEYCTFKDVTLTYHGTGTYSFNMVTWEGSIKLKTDNKAIHDYIGLSEFLAKTSHNVDIYDFDDQGNPHRIN